MHVTWNTHNHGLICRKVRADRGRTRCEPQTTQNSEAKKENTITKIARDRPGVT